MSQFLKVNVSNSRKKMQTQKIDIYRNALNIIIILFVKSDCFCYC